MAYEISISAKDGVRLVGLNNPLSSLKGLTFANREDACSAMWEQLIATDYAPTCLPRQPNYISYGNDIDRYIDECDMWLKKLRDFIVSCGRVVYDGLEAIVVPKGS